ncbi:hypothetical protein VFPPC_14416 [Pochonia chlamydosporia 170]|uniref:Uncharacterized protein n=1 Tax=Pochonia chlamydosporia 170 TaxID=1380566 RepID=A0A179FP30_METCM|nr:hypothetical protein VFPPC_14416 [Pochonia chlamydosporia 170]OAQ66990.1 hypothetical protein VFPPC_14416 [Pochonia chlamydosporia 170]
MADHDATRPPGHVDSRSGLLTPDGRARNSYETGESSRSGGRREGIAASQLPTYTGGSQHLGAGLGQAEQNGQDGIQRGGSTRRKAKYKSGGGFLVHDSISGDRRHASRGSVRDSLQLNGKASQSPRTPQSLRSNNRQSLKPNESSGRSLRDKSSLSPQSIGNRSDGSAQKDVLNKDSEEPSPPPRASVESAGDVDSTQIVQMALNLSESRRIASRRTVSRNTPPRLGPLPDGSSGSNLRQHFQQQRKSSYNNSPMFQQAQSPRLSSGKFESSFEGSGHDTHYRYHFSASTLARAQKAKEHLELMAQYRRLLEVLPPLKSAASLATSPPGSPIGNKPFRFAPGDNVPLGRHYNPLQYIRNRKVRARERKVIDGERQGFADVEGVKPWVDKVVERATSFATHPDEDGSFMPAFPGADEATNQISPDSSSRAAARVRRPRVDWFIEPCDIVADAYWLEQERHKELIEDRNWRKIFPTTTNLTRPMSNESGVSPFEVMPPFSMQDDSTMDPPISGISKVDTDLSHSSAKDRAKQTLHNIRAFPHRHGGQAHNIHHDLVWHRKDSTSDISGSENDHKDSKRPSRQGKNGGSASTNMTKDLLERQMLEMVAKDARDRELSDAFSDQEPIGSPAGVKTPENKTLSQPPSRFHSRNGSLVDTSDSDRKPAADNKMYLGSPPRYVPGRQSLDVADRPRKFSYDRDSSLPTSPELKPARGNTEPAIAANLSPAWSRSGSPTRNPISKIKQIIRDNKTNDPGTEQDDSRRVSAPEPNSPVEKVNVPDRRQSSPVKTPVPESLLLDPSKTHRRSGSTRLRADEQGPGLRGMFKGPRIDNVIRGGVSKLGDMLWKRDGSSESPPDTETTDESESEKTRGRSRSSTNVSRKPSKRAIDGNQGQPKHFLDSMPQFQHAPDLNHTHSASNSKVDLGSPGSANQSRQQSRTDLLRPPQFDPRSASSSASAGGRHGKRGDSDVSESESRHGSVPDGVRDADKRLNSMLGSSRLEDDGRSFKSRHWSIADKETPTEQTRLTRREIARMRALVLSTGVKAMEINRRAQEAHKPFRADSLAVTGHAPGKSCANISWSDIAKFCPETAQQDRGVQYYELYALAGQSLSTAIQASGRRWQASADHFTYRTSPQLQNRIGDVRSRIADDLSERSRKAADLADETNRDLALGQPLKVKVVVDIIEKMLRRRRRRLRWVRRALWLTVEWLLVGFMWYVWFMVMILRVFLGIGKGMWRGVRWLLWL